VLSTVLKSYCHITWTKTRDVLHIRFQFQIAGCGHFANPVPALVPAKSAQGTGYLSWIVIGPFWQIVHPQNQLPKVITEHQAPLLPDIAEKLIYT